MIRQLVYMFLLIPAILSAQESTSILENNKVKSAINWSKGLSWQQIKTKAKTEHKFILVDCYASWCGPCKKMDKEVFVNDSIGDAVNSKFIALEVQIDTSKNDKETIKNWYADAHLIKERYKITAFPTFLFFSPEGEIIHRSTGYMNVKKFISLTEDALNPDRQYYTLLSKYQNGVIDNKSLFYLGNLASSAGETDLAKAIALDYINNYLLKLSTEKIFAKESLAYITHYVNSSKEEAFWLIYNNSSKVNKVLERPGFAEDWINYVIYNEELYPQIFKKDQSAPSVDWNKLSESIKRKYNAYYANRTVLDAKARWYGVQKNWAEYTKYSVAFVEKYGKNLGDFDLATKAWSVFLFSMNKYELSTAIKWTKRILDRSKDSSNMIPAVMDTYANLVYKIDYLFNHKKSSFDAISIENQALEIVTERKVENFQKSFSEAIEKMKKGDSTWKNASASN